VAVNWPISFQSPFTKGARGNVELNIEELVIRGVSPRDRHGIVQEIEQELTRLINEGGMPPAFGTPVDKERPRASTKSQRIQNESVAKQIARDIYQGLGTNE
jgi:hypothetical protein